MPAHRKDLIGCKFGRLVVTGEVSPSIRASASARCGRKQYRRFSCICECGSEKIVEGRCLTNGGTRSCGCLGKDHPNRLLHGQSVGGKTTPEYNAWRGMKKRCDNPKPKYRRYSGRGIEVCPRWRNGEGHLSGFDCFLLDMGIRPSPIHSLDRYPDNDGDYEPTNCRWALPVDQVRNRSITVKVLYRGILMPLAQATETAGALVSTKLAADRLRCGWSVERAVELKCGEL